MNTDEIRYLVADDDKTDVKWWLFTALDEIDRLREENNEQRKFVALSQQNTAFMKDEVKQIEQRTKEACKKAAHSAIENPNNWYIQEGQGDCIKIDKIEQAIDEVEVT